MAGLLSPITLQINGAESVTVAADGAFNFASTLPYGTAYTVKITGAPHWQQCGITGSSGTASSQINNVVVTCDAPQALASKIAGADDQSSGNADGNGSSARFDWPVGITFNAAGSLVVSDQRNKAIRVVTTAGLVTSVPLNGESMAGQGHLVINDYGETFVAGQGGKRVYKIFSDGRTLGLGPFNYATGVAMNSNGDLFVADFGAGVITKHGALGGVVTLALDSSIGSPFGIAVDSAGTLYVTDQATHRVLKIENESKVTVLAGSTRGHADGKGIAARFNFPQGIALGTDGLVYVTDTNTVRTIFPDGTVATLAGKAEEAGAADGIGINARFADPAAIAVAPTGELYVADRLNNSIRKVARP